MTLTLSRLNAKGYHRIFAERHARLISRCTPKESVYIKILTMTH